MLQGTFLENEDLEGLYCKTDSHLSENSYRQQFIFSGHNTTLKAQLRYCDAAMKASKLYSLSL